MSDDKLQNLFNSIGNKLIQDDTLIEKKRIVSNGSSAQGSDGSVVIHINKDSNNRADQSSSQEQPLRIRTKNLNVGDKDEDDFNDYVIDSPLPPPRELDPDKLYALFEFNGDDPSHCELDRDDSVVLLNDQDNYWWLVRKDFDGKIGFAPAECLETYDERLARLNCWKNEESERGFKTTSKYPQNSSKSNFKLFKAVSFSEEVGVAEAVYINDDDDDNNDNDKRNSEIYETDIDDDYDYDDDNSSVHTNEETKALRPSKQRQNLDYQYETPYNPKDDEIASDNFPVTPLVLNKKTSKFIRRSPTAVESDLDETPLLAPSAAFFNHNNYSESIGSYSPSSSEFESPNTPPLSQYNRKVPRYDSDGQGNIIVHNQNQNHSSRHQGAANEEDDFERKANIPQSKGTRDIANSMKMLDELINDELNTTATLEDDDTTKDQAKRGVKEDGDDGGNNTIDVDSDDADITLTYDDDDDNKLSSPITLDEKKKNLSNLTESTYTNSNTSLHLTSSLTSVENESSDHEIYQQKKQAPQLNQDQDQDLTALKRSHRTSIHPEIQEIFKDSLSKMDQLSEVLRRLNESLG